MSGTAAANVHPRIVVEAMTLACVSEPLTVKRGVR
jgi:2-succinyl-5-enolpyruvyl-6-hydroxy-3-cyclohexene-1-carboxylate synthase